MITLPRNDVQQKSKGCSPMPLEFSGMKMTVVALLNMETDFNHMLELALGLAYLKVIRYQMFSSL